MGLGDFWLQSNNGKKYSLKDLKDIKPEDIAKNPKFKKLIEIFNWDSDGDGKISVRNTQGKNEWESVFADLQQAAVDNDLTSEEFGLYISQKSQNADLKLDDVNELLDIASSQGNVKQIDDMAITQMNGFVAIKIKPNTTILAKNVNENGQFSDDDFIEMKTVDSEGKEITVKREEFKTKEGTIQCIVVTRQDSKDESSTTIYGTSSYYMYEIFKGEESLKAMEFYRKGNNEYYVQYSQEGNTITHAKNGDTVESLIQKFGFKDRAEFDRLNPSLKGKKYPIVADSIVVPGHYSAKDNKIVEQGTVYGEQYNYIKTVSEAERRKFKEEHLQKLDEDIFNKLNNLKGLELSNENIGLYFSLNSYPQKTQEYIFNIIAKLAKEGKTPDEIKTYFLSDPNAPKLTRKDGTKVNINLFNEFTVQMHNFVGKQVDDTPQSVKGFIQDVMGLDITKGEGKELYEKLSKVGDPYVIMDINEMFSNIYHRTTKEYKDWHSKQVARLNSDGWKSDKSIKTTGEREYLKGYPPISKETALEMYRAVINKMTAQKGQTVTTKYDKFIEDNRDVYLREFATLTLFSLHQSGAGNLQGTAAQKDILNPSKYLLKPVGNLYDKKGKEIYETMMADCYKGNKKFESILKCYTTGYKQAGVSFDKAKMKHCMEVMQNPKSTEAQKKKALEDAFGYQVVNAAQDLIGVANFVDNVTDMALMIYGTGLIGKGLGKAVSFASKASTATRATAVITNTAKGISWGERLTQIGLSATNFAIWEGARFTVNYYTNDIEEDFSYGSGLGQRMAGGAAFGTFAGAWGQFVTQPVLKWIFKTPSQEAVTKEATAFVSKQLKGSSKFTSKEVLEAFNAGQQKAMTSLGKEAVGFASELTGFSIYEIGQKLIVGNDAQIRQILQDSKKYKPEEIDDLLKNPEELKKALKEVGCTDDVIRELTEINVGDVALGQLKTLLSFKAVGQLVYMHRAGKLPPSALNFRKEKPLEFKPIKHNGKTMYKVTYPDGTTRTVADMNGVVALSNMHYQDVTLYKPIEQVLKKDGKMELDEGITLQKNTEVYSVTFKDGTKIEAKDLKDVMGRAQTEYTIMGYENELAQKGKVELPDKQVVTFDRDNNVYKTTMEGGVEVEAPSFKELLQAIQKKTVCQSIEKTFTGDKKAIMLDEFTVIVKQEDGTYRMIVIEDGFPKEYFGKSVEEVLNKSAGVNEGKDGYKINLPDGRKVECKNTNEYISALHLMVRGEKIKGGKEASDAVEGAIEKEIADGAKGTSRTKTNDITSNTKSEKVISDRISGKKPYQKPETEVKSFVAEDDLLADTTKPKTKAKPKAIDEPRMVLRENKPVTVEQARNMLLDLGFPIEEVNAFTFDNNSLLNINYVYFMLKEKMVPDFADIDFSSSADNVIEARKDIFGFLKAETGFEYKFVNKENIAEYNKYISINNFDELSDVIDILENDFFKEHLDDLMKIIPIITKNGKEKLTVQEYKELEWINEDAFKFITPERAEFVRKINSNVPEEYKIGLNSYEDLGASETLTEELAQQYVSEVNRFIKHGVNDGTSLYPNGLKNKMREMKEISDFLDKYPLELSVDDKGLIHSHDVKKLMTRPDIEKIQKLLSEMTPEARQNIGVDRLPKPDSDIPFDKWRDFFNFISKGSFSEKSNSRVYKYVDFVRKQNIKDLDSFMEYMELLRGTYAYSWEHHFNEYFVISNNGYKNAASMLREMKNICDSISPNTFDDNFVSYQLGNIIGNQDIDFKEVTKRLKYLQEKNVKFKEDAELYRIAVSKHPDTVKLAEILYRSGFGVNYYSLDYIFNNLDMTPKKLQGMMDDFVSELMKSCDLDDNFDINLIKEAALSNDSNAIFCRIMQGDKCSGYAAIRVKDVLRKNNKAFYDKYWNKLNSPFKSNELFELGSNINDKNIELALKICDDEEFIKDFRFVRNILISTAKYNNKRLSESLLFDKSLNFEKSQIIDILRATNADNLYLANKICTDPKLNFPKEHIAGILSQTSWINSNLTEKLCFDKEFPKDLIKDIIRELNNYSKRDILDFADWICFDKDVNFPREKIADLLSVVNNVNKDFAKRLLTDKSINIPQEIIANILRVTNAQNLEEATRLCLNYKRLEIEPNQIPMLLSNANQLSIHQVRKVNKVFGREAVAKMSDGDFKIAVQFIDIKDVTNINEIPAHAKKDFLKALVACNEGLFNISDDLKKMFPMIPTNRDDYCSLLPAIVRSLGIETNVLKPEQVIKFNKSMGHLSESLAKISDTDFANLHITQEYSRNEFIQTTLQKLKGLSDNERQKVFDYFGFELHTYSVKTDKLDPKGKPIYEKHYTITGYPVNLNNGHKLAQITNPETKSFVENLRPDVIRFSKNNRIKCENPQVETLLNELAEALPELHSIVGRVQHGSHQYDVLQHSLKVMQKISQDSNFKKLSDSDKKIMLLASIMHDITKKEGTTDVMHAINGSFDTFFIAKKFNLTKEEEIKLYTLIKHHEWLSYANSSSVQSENVLTKRLQSIAYDLRHDNMFDLALMFTHADLRAVKVNDAFHDSKIGKSRINFNGEVHSFGESADIFAKRIREYIAELKKSQPILPVTKMPRASRMKQAITHVNPDGSTNIKGVYQDKDGLLIVRFNEVEDWEALGLPKGTISKGIKAGDGVDTGNIHFFVHGLDYVNQLVKFDAFGMIDSEVLLSMSYAERPESKFRFFRTQGVLLDVPTKYVHGGGNTDAGSGCGKFVSEFKKNYIFGGHRESDRLYISNLVKEATGMSDDEYVKFVEKYENKPFTDIYPEDIRNKIIKIFAEINSRVRKNGERSYNEMYGSNPSDVMGVFGYPTDLEGKIGDNIFDFVKSNDKLNSFLRQYALERDIPMYILGY